MRILGIDPGATTGWVLYDSEAKRVLEAGCFRGAEHSVELGAAVCRSERLVIEKPVAYGPTRPDVVECAWVAGILFHRFGCEVMTRREVKRILTDATNRDVRVVDDATAWAALVLLHGEGSEVKPTKTREGGSIGRVTTHERAALALVVAWLMARGLWIAEGASR